jgi:Na+/proline symporter
MFQELTPFVILSVIAIYFSLLVGISYFTGKNADNDSFFRGGRKSPWYLVAFGMIGASLSGVTFISIPGVVGGSGLNMAFSYMQVVLGYIAGYLVIAHVLMPIYYRMNLTSIYEFLEQRLGKEAYKTGAAYFLLSRTIGSAFRLYLVAIVLDSFVLGPMGVPFWGTVAGSILLIWVYTFKGGIKTIVWTDTLQTVAMLTSVILTIIALSRAMDTDVPGMIGMVRESSYSRVFFFEGGWSDPNNFFKQFLSGALITIVMTGLDQDMMQKNLSCRNIREAQKNMYSFTVILVLAKVMFLTLGALLYLYSAHLGLDIPGQTDKLYPSIALNQLSPFIGIVFIIGLIAAAYSSADSALTALTTSFCIDFLNFGKKEPSVRMIRQRFWVHIAFSILLFIIIVAFNSLNNDAVISQLFVAAGYTYGPLLGLFTFGIGTTREVKKQWVVLVCIASPVISYLLNAYSDLLLAGFEFGFLIIALNGFLTFSGLWLISSRAEAKAI